MEAYRPTLATSVVLVAALLEVAYATQLRRMMAMRRGRSSRVDDYDLERLLEQIVPEVMMELEGVSGQLVWVLAQLELQSRQGHIEAEVLSKDPDAHHLFERSASRRRFRARLALSTAGLEWGGLLRHLERMRS